jgi:hypothetical protein
MQYPSRLADSRPDPEPAGKALSPLPSPRYVLMVSLVAYLLLTTALSISQIGYVNADFVGYATIAHRLLKEPRTSITGYWSPLYSWCMAPLIAAGMDDLTAGRVVLVAGGAIYLLAVFGLVCRSHGADPGRNRMLTAAVMTVAVVQAATWATRLLDPDLLADGLLFCYFYAVLDPKLPQRPFRALLAGAAAGMAFLGKAYMLPFTLVHLPATLLIRWRMSRRGGQGAARGGHHVITVGEAATAWVVFLAGQALIAGPWVAVLTWHYGKLTCSTAGAANHANMGPAAFGNDPLWNPGLVADFIADPRLAADWSPLQDGAHFLHQLKVIFCNLNNCLGYVLPWVAFGGIFAAIGRRRRRPSARGGGHHAPMVGGDFPGLSWCVVTVAIFCGGYSYINLESRYIVPVVTPLLCLGAMLVVSRVVQSAEAGGTGHHVPKVGVPFFRWRRSVRWVIPVILLVSAQDVHRMACIPLFHPQSAKLARYRSIAEQLRGARLLPGPFAANRWHDGLYVSYAAGNVPDYLGAPLPDSTISMMEQLQRSSSAVHLRWHGQENLSASPSTTDAFVPAAPWTLVSTIKDGESGPTVIDVYALAPAKE